MTTNVISLVTARLARRVKKVSAPHPADDLSFMKRRKPKGTGIDYWLVRPTGNYAQDCDAGGNLAAEYLAYIGDHPTYGNGTLLTCIVREMIERAKVGEDWSGVHVGFLAGVNRYSMATAATVRRKPDGAA